MWGGFYINKEYSDITDISPFNNIEAGANLAKRLFKEKNADIVFAVAGASGLGIIEEAVRDKRFAIGVDSDQDYLAEGTILFSMMKRIDNGIMYITEKIINGKFNNRNYRLGLKENGVGLSPMIFTKNKIGKDKLDFIETIKIKIINDYLKVPSSYND